jgi:hypothetical protein
MRAGGGTGFAAFERAAPAAIEQAHRHPAMQATRQRFEAGGEHASLGGLAGAGRPLAECEPS